MTGPILSIQLDNSIPSYFPGQTITGSVLLLNNDRPEEIKNISITFEGNATVHWTALFSRYPPRIKTKTETLHFIAKENYFTERILLFGNDLNSITLPTGRASYQFQFTLPLILPSSFKSPIGMVHYFMEARIKWDKADVNAIVPFTVNGILDINLEPGLEESVCYEKNQNVCCLCCKSGPVGYKIALQRTGFVPGEVLQFNAEFTNHSGRNRIKSVTSSLVQISTFHAHGGKEVKIERKDFGKANCPPINGDSDSWREALRIPSLPPSFRPTCCKIIDVQYVLRLELVLSGVMVNMVAEIPIVIGTIPFRNTFRDFMPSSSISDDPPGYSGNAIVPLPSAPAFDMYPDLPPPTYAEAMQIDKLESEGGEDNGQTNLGFSDNQQIHDEPSPSAPPPGFDYVPNYVTYKSNN